MCQSGIFYERADENALREVPTRPILLLNVPWLNSILQPWINSDTKASQHVILEIVKYVAYVILEIK